MIKYLSVVLLIFFSSLSFQACKKEGPPQGGQSPHVINPYTTDSVFGEVKKKVDENPKDADAWYHLADLYERNSQYDKEIDALNRVIELRPDMGYAYFKIGTAYNRLDQSEKALEAFKKAVKFLPDYAVTYNNMAIAYGKLGRKADEINALKKATALRPNYASAHFNLGMAYLKQGNKKASMKEYEAVKKIDEGMAGALLNEINKNP